VQRPAYDGIKGTLGNGQAFGTLSVGNESCSSGIRTEMEPWSPWSAESGRKLLSFITRSRSPTALMPAGSVEGGPQVVDNLVYWVFGAEAEVVYKCGRG